MVLEEEGVVSLVEALQSQAVEFVGLIHKTQVIKYAKMSQLRLSLIAEQDKHDQRLKKVKIQFQFKIVLEGVYSEKIQSLEYFLECKFIL